MSMTPSELHDAAQNYVNRLLDNVERYQVDESLDYGTSDADVDRIVYLVHTAQVVVAGKHVARTQTPRADGPW